MKASETKSSKAAQLRQKGLRLTGRGLYSAARRSFLAAAKLGDEESQVRIGYEYAYDMTATAHQVEEAISWWKCAYKQGSWDAAFNLGMFYRDGKQWKKALKWFERAVQLGDEDGLVEIAKIHLRYGGDRIAGLHYLDLAVASKENLTEPARIATDKLLKEQEALSPSELLYMQAELLDNQGRYSEALPLLLKGAELGDSSSQILLGNYLSNGRKGIPRDLLRAIELYKKVYEEGSFSGAFNLAMTYRQGGDITEAYKWFELAAKAGDGSAELELARIWLYERNDPAKAVEHLKALFQGSAGSRSESDGDEARALLRRLQMKSNLKTRPSTPLSPDKG